MPDLPLVSPALVRRAFFVMLIADLIIPYYYMVQFSGLPWISARVATFGLIAPFLVAIASSSDVRRQIVESARASARPASLLWRRYQFSPRTVLAGHCRRSWTQFYRGTCLSLR
jgi:hypothetical protein